MRTLALMIGLSAATVAYAQGTPPGGPEVQVNVETANRQSRAAIAVEADGGTVVAWYNVGLRSDVSARRLDPAGVPRGGEIAVNVVPGLPNSTQFPPSAPAVAAHPAGGFVVVWEGAGSGGGNAIKARRFDASGQPAGGEVLVHVDTFGEHYVPRIAAGPAGYVVTWTTWFGHGATTVSARLFDASLAPRTGDIVVAPASGNPDVAFIPGGGFLIAWSTGSDIQVRFFDPAGAPIGVIVTASSGGGGGYDPKRTGTRIAVGADGSFVIAWNFYRYYAGFPGPTLVIIDEGIWVRRFDGAGAPLGPEMSVNVFDEGWQEHPSVSMLSSGGFVVAWSSVPRVSGCMQFCFPYPPVPPAQDGSGAGVYGRMFDAAGNDVGGGEFHVPTSVAGDQMYPAVAATGSGFIVAFESPDASGLGVFTRRFGSLMTPARFDVDFAASPSANGNGVLEPGEHAAIASAWRNQSGTAQPLMSHGVIGGGPGPLYETPDDFADFGVVANGSIGDCRSTGNCFVAGISGPRPAPHWDAAFAEQIVPETIPLWRVRTLHVGDSFADVPRSSPYYRFVETVFHHDVMTPCGPGNFCASLPVTREWMAVLVLRALDRSLIPPACVAGSERFTDVPATDGFCPWIEELARRGVVGGCGGGQYCPLSGVNRETMAVYLVLTREGSGYTPPACTTPVFNDVPATSPFCRWVEELARRGIVGGCGGGAYCPGLAVSREQMSVFLTGTFRLLLYAP